MTVEQVIKHAAIYIWISIRQFNGKPDQVNFEGFV